MTDLKDGGGYAEYAVATEVGTAPKPKSVNHVEAAGVPGVALTAWQALIDAAKIRFRTVSLEKLVLGCQAHSPSARITDSSSRNALSFLAARTTKRFPSPRCASK